MAKFYIKQPYDEWIFNTLTTVNKTDKSNIVNSTLMMDKIVLNPEEFIDFN